MAATALLWLDLVSAVAVLGVAACFGLAWWRLRGPLSMLLCVGFSLLGIGILTVSTSEFDLGAAGPGVDLLRLATHTSAALVLAFAYVDARTGRSRPWRALAWASAGTGLVVALLSPLLVPQVSLDPRREWLVAHAVQATAYATCFLLSGAALLRKPGVRVALVPLGFLAYAFSKYTWMLIDLTGDRSLVPFVYAWRFLMVGLLLGALVPALRAGGEPRAPA